MKAFATLMTIVAVGLVAPGQASAQDSERATVAPILIPLTGTLTTPAGEPRSGNALLVISLYEKMDDPAPIWIEQQVAMLNATGGYVVQFGATRADGLPTDLFATGAARWIGVAVTGEPEQPRMMLVSVPYAAKAATADTLAGWKPEEFIRKPDLTDEVRAEVKTALQEERSADGPVADGAVSQNFLVKSDGTVGDIPGLINSTIVEVGGNVGIGTASPGRRLSVSSSGSGNLEVFDFLQPSTSSGSVIYGLIGRSASPGESAIFGHQYDSAVHNSLMWMANYGDNHATSGLIIRKGGNVGIGTTSPNRRLSVRSIGSSHAEMFDFLQPSTTSGSVVYGLIGRSASPGESAIFGHQYDSNVDNSLMWMANYGDNHATAGLIIRKGGNVGIGTTNPTTKLTVAGDATFSGTVSGGNIIAKYQDVAEWVDSTEPFEPGTVVVIDDTAHNRVTAATRSYDSRVAGAVSPQPGLILGEPGPGRVLVAQSGRVRVKVDARYGAIRAGDLLVSSPRTGYAMRSKPIRVGDAVIHRPGTVLGKALEPLAKGTGEILVLLTLQ